MRSLLHAFFRANVALVSALIASAASALPAAAQYHSAHGRDAYRGGFRDWGGGGGFFGGNHYGHGHGDVGGTLVLFLIVTLFVVAKVWLDMSRMNPRTRRVPPGTSPVWKQVDITRVRIALTADARPFLQKEFITLARRGDVSSKRGLHRLLVQVCRSLQESESAWRYASVDNRQPMSTIFARTEFDKLAQDASTVFTHEEIRAANGNVLEGAVIVVTFVVAAKCLITDVHKLHVDGLQRLLGELSRMSPDDIVALEVSWMPAEERDLVSATAVEKLFPKMKKLPRVEAESAALRERSE